MATDTSSAPAAATLVVAAVAAALAALIAELILAKSVAAAAIDSGAVDTNDNSDLLIRHVRRRREGCGRPRRSASSPPYRCAEGASAASARSPPYAATSRWPPVYVDPLTPFWPSSSPPPPPAPGLLGGVPVPPLPMWFTRAGAYPGSVAVARHRAQAVADLAALAAAARLPDGGPAACARATAVAQATGVAMPLRGTGPRRGGHRRGSGGFRRRGAGRRTGGPADTQ
ncbi:hypothetical protein I547_7623 [Mycobacterium kansasii 824]|nr:hypothetical protein I547_7623 [Mycobacterium kansasii 824]